MHIYKICLGEERDKNQLFQSPTSIMRLFKKNSVFMNKTF